MQGVGFYVGIDCLALQISLRVLSCLGGTDHEPPELSHDKPTWLRGTNKKKKIKEKLLLVHFMFSIFAMLCSHHMSAGQV